jgi:hypothetical protein
MRKRRLISVKVAHRKDYPYRQFLRNTVLLLLLDNYANLKNKRTGSPHDNIGEIWWYTFNEFKAGKEKNLIVHDNDLQRLAT